jgi:hypothetical protein
MAAAPAASTGRSDATATAAAAAKCAGGAAVIEGLEQRGQIDDVGGIAHLRLVLQILAILQVANGADDDALVRGRELEGALYSVLFTQAPEQNSLILTTAVVTSDQQVRLVLPV